MEKGKRLVLPFQSSDDAVLSAEPSGDFIPVDNLPEGFDIFCTGIPVVDIVGMFPYIEGE